jgi:hypothetical protein
LFLLLAAPALLDPLALPMSVSMSVSVLLAHPRASQPPGAVDIAGDVAGLSRPHEL